MSSQFGHLSQRWIFPNQDLVLRIAVCTNLATEEERKIKNGGKRQTLQMIETLIYQLVRMLWPRQVANLKKKIAKWCKMLKMVWLLHSYSALYYSVSLTKWMACLPVILCLHIGEAVRLMYSRIEYICQLSLPQKRASHAVEIKIINFKRWYTTTKGNFSQKHNWIKKRASHTVEIIRINFKRKHATTDNLVSLKNITELI